MKGQLERVDIVEVHFFEKTGDIIQMNTVPDRNLALPDYTRERVFGWVASAYDFLCDVQSLGEHTLSFGEKIAVEAILNELEKLLEEQED